MEKAAPNISEKNLTEAIASIVEKINPFKIICFGFHSSSNKAWSCFQQDSESSKFHYDLLIVRREKDKRKEIEIINKVENLCSEALSLFVISHSELAIRKALSVRDPFFLKVFREGITLYSSEDSNFDLESDNLSDDEISKRERIREREWTRSFELSEKFLESGSDALGNHYNDLAVFLFHQAVEHCCIALTKAYLGYRPSTHNLARLLALVGNFEPALREVFPCNTQDEIALFSVLRRAYTDVRYKENYKVPAHLAFTLLERVSDVRDLVEGFYKEVVHLDKVASDLTETSQ